VYVFPGCQRRTRARGVRNGDGRRSRRAQGKRLLSGRRREHIVRGEIAELGHRVGRREIGLQDRPPQLRVKVDVLGDKRRDLRSGPVHDEFSDFLAVRAALSELRESGHEAAVDDRNICQPHDGHGAALFLKAR